jgi:hypothetical protein
LGAGNQGVPFGTDTYNESPDFIVDMVVTLPMLPSQPALKVKVPLLVEIETAAGFEAGLADLQRFVIRAQIGVVREGRLSRCPFSVATDQDGGRQQEVTYALLVLFRAHEIAIPKRDI